MPVLCFSFLGHVAAFGAGGGFFSSTPQFAVRQATSSVEIVISKTTPRAKPDQALRVLTSHVSSEKQVKVRTREEKSPPVPSQPVTLPLQRGALQKEAQPYWNNPAPVYPATARENGWEGLVILKVTVARTGTPDVVEVTKSSGYKILDAAALETVKRWKFKPAGLGRWVLTSTLSIPVRFTLTDG